MELVVDETPRLGVKKGEERIGQDRIGVRLEINRGTSG
jgi:hypothetical protein